MRATQSWMTGMPCLLFFQRLFVVQLICLTFFQPATIQAKQIQLDVALAHPTMLLNDDEKSENHLRISLKGFDLEDKAKRAPVNLAIVIDRSGSMQGDKIEHARQAAMQAIDRLRDEDIVSVVTYDTSVEVLVPATKARDREEIKQRIARITARGNTALHAGVSKGAAEVRKFHGEKRVNRVILLSDGLANVGPSSPSELGQLGRSLMQEGISVSTMGLGLAYNEDLMSNLAQQSGGNHTFIEDADNLVAVFQREFDDVMSVVAQKIKIRVKLADGVRPVKVLNQPDSVDGQLVSIELAQLVSRQERYFVIELEIAHGKSGSSRPVAEVAVEYKNAITDTQDKLTHSVEAKFTDSKHVAEAAVNKAVLASCVLQIANERNRLATEKRDNGDVDGAARILQDNAAYLEQNYRQLGSEELKRRSELNAAQAGGLSDKDWNRNRKSMRETQAADAAQQTYSGAGTKNP